MYILGIETSCDETAASVIKVKRGDKVDVLSNVISSQIEIHQQYGGVVPEVAAREHVLNILPVVNQALKESNITKDDIDLIAVTKGPGLITSLITGLETARTLAFAWKKKIIEVNHIKGHIYSNFIAPKTPIRFPALILTVSGGHTNLILMDKKKRIKVIGETRDDAAGEAYDKGAKMLGLSYPGGPIIAKYAEEFAKTQQTSNILLPRPMINSQDSDFSFSGLKTALLYKLKKDDQWKNRVPEYCFVFQQAILDVLISKTIKTAHKYRVKTIMVAGGVSANNALREQMTAKIENELDGVNLLVPDKQYTTDNAAMIAMAGYFTAKQQKLIPFSKIQVNASLQLK